MNIIHSIHFCCNKNRWLKLVTTQSNCLGFIPNLLIFNNRDHRDLNKAEWMFYKMGNYNGNGITVAPTKWPALTMTGCSDTHHSKTDLML